MKQKLVFRSLLFLGITSVTSFWTQAAQALLLVGNTELTTNGGYNIVKFDEFSGQYLGEFIPTGSGGLVAPDDLTFGPDGNLYISSGKNPGNSSVEPSAILRYNGVTGEFIDVFATSSNLIRPYGNAFGPDGNLYVSSFLSDQILRYNGVTGEFIDVFASGNQLPGGLNGPDDLLFTPDGNLLVTTQGSVAVNGTPDFSFGLPSEILKFNIQTGASSVFAQQPTPLPDSLQFVSFLGLAIAPDGNIFSSDFANGIRVYDINTGTLLKTITTNYTGTTPSNNFIGNLTFTPNGNLFTVGFDITQNNIGSILRYDGITGEPLPSAGNTGSIFVSNNPNLIRPIGITFTPSNPEPTDVPEPTSIIGLLSFGAFVLTQKIGKKLG